MGALRLARQESSGGPASRSAATRRSPASARLRPSAWALTRVPSTMAEMLCFALPWPFFALHGKGFPAERAKLVPRSPASASASAGKIFTDRN